MTFEEPLVVDNFYRDPLKIRQVALHLPYAALPTFRDLYQSHRSLISSHVVETFAALVGAPIHYDNGGRTFGVFRIAMGKDDERINVHRDLTEWSAVVHLSLDDDLRGGTAFFRHRATGLIGDPVSADGKPQLIAGALKDRLLRDCSNAAAWEIHRFVSNRFNRLVLFRGRDYFHDALGRGGNGFANARITHNFFFSCAGRTAVAG